MAWMYVIRPVRAGMVADPSDEEAEIVTEHFAYLKRMRAQGLVRLAGPSVLGDDSFGIVLLDTEDEQAARTVMEDDPAVARGVMRGELRPFHLAVS
jgi:uncharacterized protein YciI